MNALLSISMLSGCLRGLFADYGEYQATQIYSSTPRIVAIRTAPLEIVSGQPLEIDALVIAPLEANIGPVTVEVCGLGRDTYTTIWGVDCFEEPTEVTFLGQGATPLSLSTPAFPEIEAWESRANPPVEEDFGEDSGADFDCSHYLPLLLRTSVDGKEIFGASFNPWYTAPPRLTVAPLSSAPQNLLLSGERRQGATLEAEFELHVDSPDLIFHWYIDAGELSQTGQTIVHEYQRPSPEMPSGVVRSRNQWSLPNQQGPYRIWVVAHHPYDQGANMTWKSSTVELP